MFSFQPTVLANDGKQRIFDEAELLTDNEVQQLEQLTYEHSKKHEIDFIIVTTPKAGKDIKKFVQDYYDDNAPGYDKPHGNAVIFAIDMDDAVREFYLAGFYKGKKYIDDTRINHIISKITPYLKDGNYYTAFATLIETGSEYAEYVPGIDPEGFYMQTWFHLLAAIVIAGGIVFFMAYNSGGKVTVNERTYTGDFRVIHRKDRFITKSVTRRRKPKNNSSGGGGGITGGGHSHSGGRGSF